MDSAFAFTPAATERTTPVTRENVGRFLGQTTSYSSGLGSQLGIAVILDTSEKTAPLGHQANYVHWLEPKLHGVTDPAYPSHMAVLVVNGNTPLRSGFAGRKVAATDALAQQADGAVDRRKDEGTGEPKALADPNDEGVADEDAP